MDDLDALMSLDPLELSAQDIDRIIAFQREARKRWEGGGKPQKSKPKQEVGALLEALEQTKPAGPKLRRI